MRTDREQKLLDIMFQVVLKVHNHPYFKDKSDEEVCAWVLDQVNKCGFKAIPMGSSWGVLE